MAQSDARFGYRAKLGRTDHNLSQPFGFTCAPGMLLPIWEDFATPGDSYYIQHDLPLLRSSVLVAPTMCDVKVHYETFFVPIQMIYQPFENSNFAISPYLSSFITSANDTQGVLPKLDYAHTLSYVIDDKAKFEGFRLADILGLQAENWCDDPGGAGVPHKGGLADFTPNFFPWQLCAYQCIFQHYYRLDDKSSYFNYYNLDSQHGASTFYNAKLFNLHYRAWDFDYYTSVYRSPIISDDNVNSLLPNNNYNSLSSTVVGARQSDGSLMSTPSSISNYGVIFGNVSGTEISKTINTVAIRQLFANEKLAMITGRTKKNYDSQVLAHYGVSVPHDVKHDITLIKHDVFDLHVQEVTSLSATSDAPLGDLAGKSYASGNGKQFKFTAPCHGVIMTIFSIEPKRRYIGGFDRINAVTDTFSLPTPEFDRLGNTPMYGYECGKLIGDTNPWNASDIIGWKERYYQWKRKPAKCTLFALNPNQTNYYGSFFIASRPFAFVRTTDIPHISTDIADAPHPQLESEFYINPGFLDNLCTVNYQPEWQHNGYNDEDWNYSPWLAYSRDPFIVDSFIKAKKVSWMSKDGEPIYD